VRSATKSCRLLYVVKKWIFLAFSDKDMLTLFSHLSHSSVMSVDVRAGQTGITNSSVAQPCAYTSQALSLVVLAAIRILWESIQKDGRGVSPRQSFLVLCKDMEISRSHTEDAW
jgi:hypothetical protein